MVNKVGKATRFGKDMYWWYNTGKKLYNKGKDIYDQYFYNSGPDFSKAFNDGDWKYFGESAVSMEFYVC